MAISCLEYPTGSSHAQTLVPKSREEQEPQERGDLLVVKDCEDPPKEMSLPLFVPPQENSFGDHADEAM